MHAKPSYRPQIDSLRALAALAVMESHFVSEDAFWGHLGVRLFFVISGFLITGILLRLRDNINSGIPLGRAIGHFIGRRALRILPAYYVLLLFLLAIDLDGIRSNAGWYLLMGSNVLFSLRNQWGIPWETVPWWSLAVEEQFYVFWPVVILALPRRAILPILLLLMTVSLIWHIIVPTAGRYEVASAVLPFGSFDALGAGALLAIFRKNHGRFPLALPSAGLAGFLSCLVILILYGRGWQFQTFALVPLSALVAACSAGVRGPVGRLLDCQALQWLGQISYGMYLYHLFVWYAFMWAQQQWLPTGRGFVLFICGVLGTIAVASASWFLLERPIIRLKRFLPYPADTFAEAEGRP